MATQIKLDKQTQRKVSDLPRNVFLQYLMVASVILRQGKERKF